MAVLAGIKAFEILDQLGINTDDQRIYEVVIRIKHDDAVRITIKRYLDTAGIQKEIKRYNLLEIETVEERHGEGY